MTKNDIRNVARIAQFVSVPSEIALQLLDELDEKDKRIKELEYQLDRAKRAHIRNFMAD